MASNKLTNSKCKNAKADEGNKDKGIKPKPYKLTDGDGLYLQVLTTGIKSFRRNYRYNGKQVTYTFGKYPAVTLAKARELNREVSALLADGKDPRAAKKQQKLSQLNQKPFSHYANDWLQKQKDEGRAETTLHDMRLRIDKNLIPALDKLDMRKVTTADLLGILQVVSNRGARETAIRLAGILVKIFAPLLILGLIKNNPAQGVNELLTKPDPEKKSNFKHITDPIVLGRLLIAIDKPPPRQDIVVTQALKLMPLVFLRPINLRELKWEYIDFTSKTITIPRSKMKVKSKKKPDFIIPLSHQAIRVLKVLEPLTGDKEFVFVTGQSRNGKPLSECTTTQQLRNKIIDPVTAKPFGVTSHGFRHTASTLMNELGYEPDAIELQLDHNMPDLGSGTRATYNKAVKLALRTKIMQEWADYLDGLKAGNVIQFPADARKVA